MGEVDPHLRAGHGLFEALAGDAVDAGIGRGGDDLVAALTQNGDGLRADQASAADDDDLHGLPSLVDDWKCSGSQASALGFGFQLRPLKKESAPSETGRRCGNVRRRNPERPRSGWGHFRALPHRNIIGRVTSISRHWRKPNRTLPYGSLAGPRPIFV